MNKSIVKMGLQFIGSLIFATGRIFNQTLIHYFDLLKFINLIILSLLQFPQGPQQSQLVGTHYVQIQHVVTLEFEVELELEWSTSRVKSDLGRFLPRRVTTISFKVLTSKLVKLPIIHLCLSLVMPLWSSIIACNSKFNLAFITAAVEDQLDETAGREQNSLFCNDIKLMQDSFRKNNIKLPTLRFVVGLGLESCWWWRSKRQERVSNDRRKQL